jgi:hypothetical protein
MALTGEERAEPRGIDLHVTAPRPNALSGGLRGLVVNRRGVPTPIGELSY